MSAAASSSSSEALQEALLHPSTTSLLRLSTAGSVDDGKSTLIGRLLHDTRQIFSDQLDHVVEASKRRGFARTELALLTDGLRAEREQGITIDVAYRYFATSKRKFIVADTPGHVQYTRNMVTGASTADVAVILVDARKGLLEQSRRHSFVAALLGVTRIAVCINKMDLVDWSAERFAAIREEALAFLAKLARPVEPTFIPIAALHGDNVVDPSTNMPWYQGPTLLEWLERVPNTASDARTDARFPVQWVIRPQTDEHHDYRAYAGTVAGGVFRPGDEVTILPAGHRSTITSIDTYDGVLDEAHAPLSVALRLAHDIDIARGDMIVAGGHAPTVGNELRATLCWMSTRALTPRSTWAIKHTTRTARAMVTGITFRYDVNTLVPEDGVAKLSLNDIAEVTLKTTAPLVFDPYARNRTTGSFILIDEATNETVGAGMIEG